MSSLQTINAQTMSSREIAEITGKQHKEVMRDIRAMFEELEMESAQFCADYLDDRNRVQPCFNLDRYYTEVLITGYDIKRRAAVINRWYDLETSGNTNADEKEALVTRLSFLEQKEFLDEKHKELEEELAMVTYRRQQLVEAARDAVPGTRFLVSRQGLQRIPADSSMPVRSLPRW